MEWLAGRSSRFPLVALLLLLLSGATATSVQSNEDSLYRRVGGYDVIASIATDFTKGLGGDPVLRPYFFARSSDSRQRILQMFRELLCADAGGPCNYIGRDMKTAHAGLKFGEPEWDALMALWDRTLEAHELAPSEKDDMVEIFAGYKGDIFSGVTPTQ
jgi:hemoglobin